MNLLNLPALGVGEERESGSQAGPLPPKNLHPHQSQPMARTPSAYHPLPPQKNVPHVSDPGDPALGREPKYRKLRTWTCEIHVAPQILGWGLCAALRNGRQGSPTFDPLDNTQWPVNHSQKRAPRSTSLRCFCSRPHSQPRSRTPVPRPPFNPQIEPSTSARPRESVGHTFEIAVDNHTFPSGERTIGPLSIPSPPLYRALAAILTVSN